MNLRPIPNPDRQCGNLVEGGFYLRSDFSVHGTYNAWTWCMGRHIIGEEGNLCVTVPPRQALEINLPVTLLRSELALFTDYVYDEEKAAVHSKATLRHVPVRAVIDHVGKDNYTPYQFASEVMEYGPSRRVSPDMAKLVAGKTPLPIVFTHDDMPLVDFEALDEAVAWAEANPQRSLFAPSHTYSNWGLTIFQNDGSLHWMVAFIRAMYTRSLELGKKWKNPADVLPPYLAEQTLFTEQIFGISWITSVIKVVTGEETESELKALQRIGIEPVIAEKKKSR